MILITGASGFIGRNLATYLHEKGENVVASGRKENDEFFSKNGIPYVKLDISKREDYSNIEKNNIKKIVHLDAIAYIYYIKNIFSFSFNYDFFSIKRFF